MIAADELERLDSAVERAVLTGRGDELTVLGYGEISLVVAWPGDRPRWAVKRLPPFPSVAAFEAYRRVLDDYLAALGERGVAVLDTSLLTSPRRDGRVQAYVAQPVLPAGDLAVEVLRGEQPDAEHPLLVEVLRTTVAAVDDRVGLDAQLSNWGRLGERTVYFDVTTPLLRDASHRVLLDTGVFLAALPWALRAPMRRFAIPDMVARYHDTRLVLLDFAVTLLRERLGDWLPAALQAIEQQSGLRLSADDIRRDYRGEKLKWGALLWLRRADRGWQRGVRRRPYPFLLPGSTGW